MMWYNCSILGLTRATVNSRVLSNHKGMATMNEYTPKLCGTCKKELPATAEYFHRDKSKKDGLTSCCKLCVKVHKKRWYDANHDHAIAYSKQWVADNYEHVLMMHREWGKQNPQKKKQYNDNWKANNREKHLASRRRRYVLHAETRRLEVADWRKQNPDKVRIQFKVRQSRKRSAEGTHSPTDFMQIYHEQNERCAYCGISISLEIKGDIHVDHIIPLSGGGSNWPENLALTCAYCNLSKGNKSLHEWMLSRGW